jgi:hypothetical protein
MVRMKRSIDAQYTGSKKNFANQRIKIRLNDLTCAKLHYLGYIASFHRSIDDFLAALPLNVQNPLVPDNLRFFVVDFAF